MAFPGPRPETMCSECRCAPATRRGLCRPCRDLYAKRGWEPPLRAWDVNRINTGECRVGTCDRPSRSRGLCHTHYNRTLREIPLERPFRKTPSPVYLTDGYTE